LESGKSQEARQKSSVGITTRAKNRVSGLSKKTFPGFDQETIDNQGLSVLFPGISTKTFPEKLWQIQQYKNKLNKINKLVSNCLNLFRKLKPEMFNAILYVTY
jgi:hypothetical protein